MHMQWKNVCDHPSLHWPKKRFISYKFHVNLILSFLFSSLLLSCSSPLVIYSCKYNLRRLGLPSQLHRQEVGRRSREHPEGRKRSNPRLPPQPQQRTPKQLPTELSNLREARQGSNNNHNKQNRETQQNNNNNNRDNSKVKQQEEEEQRPSLPQPHPPRMPDARERRTRRKEVVVARLPRVLLYNPTRRRWKETEKKLHDFMNEGE